MFEKNILFCNNDGEKKNITDFEDYLDKSLQTKIKQLSDNNNNRTELPSTKNENEKERRTEMLERETHL